MIFKTYLYPDSFRFAMVNQPDTLKRLQEEKDYEDTLAENLHFYFLDSLDAISSLTVPEKNKIKAFLKTIISDSRKHSYLFSQLQQMVLEHGQNSY